jgi:homoserine kinase type II
MALEMLWERAEPSEVLRERFGFADDTEAAAWAVHTARDVWGIAVDACERIVLSDHNAMAWLRTASGDRLLKWSVAPERSARLAVVAEVARWLGDRGLPVSAPVPARDGRVQVEADGRSIALQRVVDGGLLDVGRRAEVHAAGAVLARLHTALREYPASAVPEGTVGDPEAEPDRIAGWLGAVGDTVPERATAIVRRALTEPVPGPLQLVHGDYRSANVLCRADEVAGVIDLEEMRYDHPVVELARSAVMLGTRYHNWGPVPRRVRQDFLEGYRSVVGLSDEALRWWEALVLWYSWALVPSGDDPTGWRAAAEEQLAAIDAA